MPVNKDNERQILSDLDFPDDYVESAKIEELGQKTTLTARGKDISQFNGLIGQQRERTYHMDQHHNRR